MLCFKKARTNGLQGLAFFGKFDTEISGCVPDAVGDDDDKEDPYPGRLPGGVKEDSDQANEGGREVEEGEMAFEEGGNVLVLKEGFVDAGDDGFFVGAFLFLPCSKKGPSEDGLHDKEDADAKGGPTGFTVDEELEDEGNAGKEGDGDYVAVEPLYATINDVTSVHDRGQNRVVINGEEWLVSLLVPDDFEVCIVHRLVSCLSSMMSCFLIRLILTPTLLSVMPRMSAISL